MPSPPNPCMASDDRCVVHPVAVQSAAWGVDRCSVEAAVMLLLPDNPWEVLLLTVVVCYEL